VANPHSHRLAAIVAWQQDIDGIYLTRIVRLSHMDG
jgi:tRNA splicing endonuclease